MTVSIAPDRLKLPAGRVKTKPTPAAVVRPSVVDPATATPFTLDQELEPFGRWTESPIWVPPLGVSDQMGQTMLRHCGRRQSPTQRWAAVQKQHRSQFTQVREIELCKASIRLPQGRFFVTVTPPEHFDKITDTIPGCVQTRLDEFMAGPGRRPDVKVAYLKPLCIEVDDQLILTTRNQLESAIERIRGEVLEHFDRHYWGHQTRTAAAALWQQTASLPAAVFDRLMSRRRREIDQLEAKLEFQRRKTAHRAMRLHHKTRTHGCTYDEMLELTNPLQTADVIGQYCAQEELSHAKRDQLIQLAIGSVPWFVTISLSAGALGALAASVAIAATTTAPVAVCDPVFVAQMPEHGNVLLKIGHFDVVAGVTHVEL